uniref:Uncharacterized protein n=1 Tax=Arundo donax TaxID=35708 RepID=A0A0A9CJH6_ARUDO
MVVNRAPSSYTSPLVSGTGSIFAPCAAAALPFIFQLLECSSSLPSTSIANQEFGQHPGVSPFCIELQVAKGKKPNLLSCSCQCIMF